MKDKPLVVVLGRVQFVGDTSDKERIRYGALLRPDGEPICQKVKLEPVKGRGK